MIKILFWHSYYLYDIAVLKKEIEFNNFYNKINLVFNSSHFLIKNIFYISILVHFFFYIIFFFLSKKTFAKFFFSLFSKIPLFSSLYKYIRVYAFILIFQN